MLMRVKVGNMTGTCSKLLTMIGWTPAIVYSYDTTFARVFVWRMCEYDVHIHFRHYPAAHVLFRAASLCPSLLPPMLLFSPPYVPMHPTIVGPHRRCSPALQYL